MPSSKLDCVMSASDAGMVIAVASFPVVPERLFEALTDTVEIGRWWGGRRGGSFVSWIGQPEPGSSWRAEGVFSHGKVFVASGQFLDVERPHRFVQSWQSSWTGPFSTIASIRLELVGDMTVLSLVHKGFEGRHEACEAQAQIWWKIVKWLRVYLQAEGSWRAEPLTAGLERAYK